MFNVIKYIKERFIKKTNNDSCEYDFDNSLKSVLDKRFDREGRAYDNLSKQYEDLDNLPQKEYNSLLHVEIEKIRQEDDLEDIREKSLLRTIKTLRTKEEIRDAVKRGHKILKLKVQPSKDIRVTDLHIKDKQTGKISIEPYTYHNLPRDDRYKVVKKVTYYPYNFPSKVAAYLLPDDLEVGERVILEDLIEDIVGASHAWGTYRQDSAEAVWDGEKFKVDCRSYDMDITFG